MLKFDFKWDILNCLLGIYVNFDKRKKKEFEFYGSYILRWLWDLWDIFFLDQ